MATAVAVAGVGAAVLAIDRSDGTGSLESAPTAGDDGGTTATTAGPGGPGDQSDPGAGGTTATTGEPGEPPGPADWSDLFEEVRSGVVRIRASSCGGMGAGTGFLLAGDRVATAAHVVAGAVAVSVETESGTYRATVEAIDESADLASLRLSARDPGHVFDFAPTDPDPGSGVAVIGHPLDGPVSITAGTVSGTHRTVETRVGELSGLLQTDAAANPGNSGGPVVTPSGDVAGVVSAGFPEYEGLGFAVESSTAATWFEGRAGSSRATPASCDSPLGPDVSEVDEIAPPEQADWAVGVAATFDAYFGGINTGDYETAWLQRSPAVRGSLDDFAAAVRTSYDFGFVIDAASHGAGRADVWLEFTSIQDPSLGPEPGESCTHWSLDYVLLEQPDGSFLIDQVTGHAGTSGHLPCL